MNLVREPDAGNPHVRFDERVGETEYWLPGLRRCPKGRTGDNHPGPVATAPPLDSTEFSSAEECKDSLFLAETPDSARSGESEKVGGGGAWA